jgi:hypothetical protein
MPLQNGTTLSLFCILRISNSQNAKFDVCNLQRFTLYTLDVVGNTPDFGPQAGASAMAWNMRLQNRQLTGQVAKD